MHPVEGLSGAACAVILSNDEAADTEALLRPLAPVALADDEP
jgi:hypothetical protein